MSRPGCRSRRRTSASRDRPPQPLIPHEVVLTHSGSGQTYRLPVSFDAAGIAETRWPIPQDARLGVYQVELVRDEKRRDIRVSIGRLSGRAVPRADDAGRDSAAEPPAGAATAT